eukprot:TRINITY_DN38410_c0_g1_i1.p1 TRINITY_DN38410_c0_g1~~TRINITY_DN38410_c0_g1_i1.p1  ORF type:complete len:395 (-),score=53.60 TRINITY_DN38410_c0_g1_i1:103-1203(-)
MISLITLICMICCIFLPTLFFHSPNEEAGHSLQGSLQEQRLRASFASFTHEHRRLYLTEEEKDSRFKIFMKNMRQIEEFNGKESGVTLGANKFVDLTDDEFQKHYTRKPKTFSLRSTTYHIKAEGGSSNLKDNVDIDWVRDKQVTMPVKDQAMCGSCWTFGSTNALEGLYARTNKKLLRFSEQNMVDCCNKEHGCMTGLGCNGGLATDSFPFLKKYGVTTEAAYPYHALDMTCKEEQIKKTGGEFFKINDFGKVPEKKNTEILEKLKIGPLSISLDVPFALRFYKEGVIKGACPIKSEDWRLLDHTVTLVGAGNDATDGPYWKIMNSWGPNWGKDGYTYIKRDLTDGAIAPCGMNLDVYWVAQLNS